MFTLSINQLPRTRSNWLKKNKNNRNTYTIRGFNIYYNCQRPMHNISPTIILTMLKVNFEAGKTKNSHLFAFRHTSNALKFLMTYR